MSIKSVGAQGIAAGGCVQIPEEKVKVAGYNVTLRGKLHQDLMPGGPVSPPQLRLTFVVPMKSPAVVRGPNGERPPIAMHPPPLVKLNHVYLQGGGKILLPAALLTQGKYAELGSVTFDVPLKGTLGHNTKYVAVASFSVNQAPAMVSTKPIEPSFSH